MKTTRFGALLFAALVLADAAVATAQQKDYQSELRNARNIHQQRKFPEVVKMCDAMLKEYQETWQTKEVTWLKIDSLVLDNRFEGALKELADFAKKFPEDAELQYAAQMRTGDTLRSLKKFDEAIAAYRKLAADAAAKAPDQAADALSRAGDVYCTDLGKPAEGVAAYREVETKFTATVIARAAEAGRRAAVAIETQIKDMPKAAEAYKQLTEKYPASFDAPNMAAFFAKTADCFLAAGKPDLALAAAKTAEEKLETTATKSQFALRQIDLLLAAKKVAEARTECERLLCAYPLEQDLCQSAQARVVETYRAESKFNEALGAARTLYDAAANETQIRNAAQVVAQAFLSVDGNLERANEFLNFQRFGRDGLDGKPQTPDDIAKNHLADVKYPPPSPETSKRFQQAISAQDKSYQGYRAQGYLNLYSGKPKEGAAAFYMAFKAATLPDVPAAAQELVLVGMKAYTASFRGLDTVFDFITYGPKGKDGKQNIPNPFAGL